jgi:hypothetical protein
MPKKMAVLADWIRRVSPSFGRLWTVYSLKPGYAAMAADEAREHEAKEWVEGLPEDAFGDPRRRGTKACR